MEVNIETAIRICPLSLNGGEIVCVQPNTINNTIQIANTQSYPVNYALPMECCQSTVFTTAVAPLVNYTLEGCDVSIVTLGQSGMGKSYTLLGPGLNCASSESDHGIIPRFVRELFTKLRQHRDRSCTVHIAWSQISGDTIQDLLGVGSVECASISDVFQLIQLGMSNMTQKCAHTLFTVTLEQQWVVEATVQHRVSTASFADLAGSEKVLVYDSNGMMQTIPTDLGMQALQRCILSLSENSNQYNHYFIPYTQSVLTTLLKDSFGGRAKTLLICCISPLAQDLTETLYTLQLAFRAQMIKNFVTVNSYTTESMPENLDIFGLQFAANQLFKLVSNAEELFQRLVSNGLLPKSEQEQISQWLMLKQECEDCLSENSEPHRSLERIDEEIEASYKSTSSDTDAEEDDEDEDEDDEETQAQRLSTKIDAFIQNFRISTNQLVSDKNLKDISSTNSAIKDNINNSYNVFHIKGARGRRTSIHSAEELRPVLSLNLSSKNADSPIQCNTDNTLLTYESKKKKLKQILTAMQLCQKEIVDLEKTIKVKENLKERLLRNKNTKYSAQQKFEQKSQQLRKDFKSMKSKLLQAQLQKNESLEEKYKCEVLALEEKLKDLEFVRGITEEDDVKLNEIDSGLNTFKKKLETLKKYRVEKEKQKHLLEKELKEEKIKLFSHNNETSRESLDKSKRSDNKIVALLSKSDDTCNSNLSLSIEELDSLRHEIRNLRKTRDHLLDQRCKINLKSQNKKIINDSDERKLIQYEEAIEAIDLAIEYKNSVICGHQPLHEKVHEDASDKMLMERLLKLTENEMRILLHRYFEKIVDLRSSSKKLEMQLLEFENQHDNLACRVQYLSHTLQQVRLEAERRVALLQQQQEEKLHKIWKHISGGGGDSDKVLSKVMGSNRVIHISGAGKQVDKSSFMARWTRYRQDVVPKQLHEITPTAPQATVSFGKNKIFMQQNDHT